MCSDAACVQDATLGLVYTFMMNPELKCHASQVSVIHEAQQSHLSACTVRQNLCKHAAVVTMSTSCPAHT